MTSGAGIILKLYTSRATSKCSYDIVAMKCNNNWDVTGYLNTEWNNGNELFDGSRGRLKTCTNLYSHNYIRATIFVQLYSCNYIRATISGLEYEISYGGIMRQLGAWRPSSGRHPAQAVTSSIKHSNRFTANKFYAALCYAKGISRISFSWIKSACSILLD